MKNAWNLFQMIKIKLFYSYFFCIITNRSWFNLKEKKLQIEFN